MDDRMERWTVTAFDDASALIALPPRERWLPADPRPTSRLRALALTAGVLALLFGVASWLVAEGRLVPAAPQPTPAGALPLVRGTSEPQTWGTVWSSSLGAAALRPTWLPISNSVAGSNVTTSAGRLHRYSVGYYAEPLFGPRSIPLLFLGEGPDALPSRLGPGEHQADVTVRGQSGKLITGDDGAQFPIRVTWIEGGIRYTINAAKGISAGDLLRVAESLRPVVDANGRVGTP